MQKKFMKVAKVKKSVIIKEKEDIDMNKKYGFTFAEVMITLVIIGVVSMLVVPALLDSSNQKLNAAAAKKARYEISQAAMLVQTECIRWRNCDTAVPTLLRQHLKNNEEIKYKIQNPYPWDNSTSLTILASVDGDSVTDIEYTVNNTGGIAENTPAAGHVSCSAENYSNGVANRDCTTWPTAGDWLDGME